MILITWRDNMVCPLLNALTDLQEVKRRIIMGTFSLSAGYSDAYYEKSQELRSILYRAFAKAFQKADIFVCPTAPTVSPPVPT